MRPPLDHNFVMFRSPRVSQVAWLVYDSDGELTAADIARATGIAAPTLSRLLDDLVTGGVLVERKVGRARLVRANIDAPFYRPLRDLLAITCGPPTVLSAALADVEGIEEVSIFGSWAARAGGEPGHLPRDIDVLVIGDPPRQDLLAACDRAAEALSRPVNPLVASRDAVAARTDALLRKVLDGPRVPVAHTPRPITRTAADLAREHEAAMAELDAVIASLTNDA